MKIVICWSHVSGYMAACWRALAKREGVDVSVIAFAPEGDAAFSQAIMAGLRCELLDPIKRNDSAYIRQQVESEKPDVVVIPGWLHPPYVALATGAGMSRVRFVMGIDTSFTGSFRQRMARFKIGRLIDRMDLIVVAGERAFQLARFLKVPEAKILRGVYGFDDEPLAKLHGTRSGNWPRSFLYVGRYVPEKGLDILLDGYARYRKAVNDPWPLSCCGSGSMAKQIETTEGVRDLGFVQPEDLPGVLLQHGVFVFVSRFEPWGVALAEAMGSGLPAICSEACGASVELMRHLHNGLLVPTNDSAALADALKWMHLNHDRLPEMGERAREFALPFAAERWAERWGERIKQLS